MLFCQNFKKSKGVSPCFLPKSLKKSEGVVSSCFFLQNVKKKVKALSMLFCQNFKKSKGASPCFFCQNLKKSKGVSLCSI